MKLLYFREEGTTAQELLGFFSSHCPPCRSSFFLVLPFHLFSAHTVWNAGKAILDPKTSGHLVFLGMS